MALSASEVSIVLRAYDEASSTIRSVEKSADSLGGTFTKVGQNALGVAVGIAAIAAAGQAFNALGSVIVGFNSRLEQSTIAWTTFTGSADAAHGIIQQIQQIAATTPFEFKDVDNAAKRFVNAGFSAQQALNFITPLSNAVASVGLNAEGVDRVSLALAQMTQKTRVQGQEMLQLTEAQIPAWDILAQATGKPIPVLQKMVEQGKISAKEFTDAFGVFYGETGKFANAAHDQSLTFQGSMSTIRDELNIVGSTAFKPLFDVLSQAARAFAAFVQSDAFTVWGAKIQAVVGFIVDSIMGLSGAFSSTLGGILDIVNTVGQAIYAGLQWLNPFAAHSQPLVSQVEEGVAAIQASYESLGGLTSTFAGLGSAFGTLTTATETFSSTVDGLSTKTEKALAVMGPGVTAAFTEASAAIDTAKGNLADIKTAWDDAADALVPLKDNLEAAQDALKNQQTALGDLRSGLADAKAAFDPLNDALKDAEQNAKDAEQAIKSLTTAPIEGTAAFDAKISAANIGLKQQALALSNVKQSTAYQTLGEQITTATTRLKEMQRAQTTFIPNVSSSATDAQKRAHADAIENNRVLAASAREAIAQQQAGLDVLKAKQQDLLGPAQKELDTRRNNLDAINLEKDATIGVAQERIKATAAAALGIKEQTEGQITVAIAAAKAAREVATGQVATLSPQVAAQQAVMDALSGKIREQERAVRDAQATTDAANTTYSEAKDKVNDLGTAYRDTKSQVANYEQQLKSTIAAGDMQVQKINEAKKAVDAAAKATGSGAVTAKTDVLAGLDIEGSKTKIKQFTEQVATTRANISGHLDAIRNKWDASWNAVKGVFDRLLAGFGGFNAVKPVIDFLGRFGVAVGALVVSLAGAGAIIGGFLSALAPFAPAFVAVLSPIGLLVIGIGTLAAAWTLNVGNIQQSASGLAAAFAPLQELPAIVEKAFGGDITGALSDFVGVLQDVRGRIIETLAGWGAAFVDWLLPQLPALTDQFTTFASKVVGWILDQGDKFLKNLLKWGTAFVDWIAPRIPDILKALSEITLKILQWIRDEGKTIANRLGEWAATFIAWVTPLLPKLGTALEQIATAVINWIGPAAKIILGALADWAGAFLGWVLPLIPDLLGALLALVGDMTKWIIEEGLPKIVGVLGDWGHAFTEWIGPNIQPMLDEAKKLADRLGKWILERAPEVGAQMGFWGASFVNWVKETVLPVIGPALDKLINGGEGFVGILPWIKAQADAFPEALGFWVVKFLLWVDDVVKGMPEAMIKITNSIVDWVKTDGVREFALAAAPLGEALVKGILTGLVLAPFLISKALLDMIPGVVTGVQKGLGQTPEQRLPAGGLPASAQPTPSDTLTNPRGIGGMTASGLSAAFALAQKTAAQGAAATPYIWGGAQGRGSMPDIFSGGDCSGFVSWIYQQATGKKLPAYVAALVDNKITAQIDRSASLPGDLAIFNPGGAPDEQHVGIVSQAGGGKMIDESTAGGGGVRERNVGASAQFYRVLGISAKDAAVLVKDLGSQIDGTDQYIQSIPVGVRSAGDTLDELAAQTGNARGSFLQVTDSITTTTGASAAFASIFGLSLNTVDMAARATVDAVAGIGNNKLWQTIDSNAAIAAKSLKTYLQDSGAGSIDVVTASLDDLEKASGLTLPQMQTRAQEAGKDLKTWLQDTGVPAAKDLAKNLGLGEGVAGAADKIKKPVNDATGATKDMGAAFDVAASTQIAAVLLLLREGLLGEGPFSGKGLIQAVKDFTAALLAIPTDIKVTITTDQAGSMAASGGGFSQSGISEGSSRNNVSTGGLGNLADQSVRADLRAKGNYFVGQNSDGSYYAEKRASGGPVRGGVPYFVGEHGPELFTPQQSGSISPAGMGGGIDYMRLAAAIASAMQSAPAPRVAVEDIRSSFLRIGMANGGVVGLA